MVDGEKVVVGVAIILVLVFMVGPMSYQLLLIDNQEKNPLDDSFGERWEFTVSLDNNTYALGDEITITISLKCLESHESSRYLSWNDKIRIINETGGLKWTLVNELYYVYHDNYHFQKNINYGDVIKVILTEEKEIDFEVSGNMFKVPLLDVGKYYIVVDPPQGETFEQGDTTNQTFSVI